MGDGIQGYCLESFEKPYPRAVLGVSPTQVWRQETHTTPKLNPFRKLRSRSSQSPSKTTPTPSEATSRLHLDELQCLLPSPPRIRVCVFFFRGLFDVLFLKQDHQQNNA